jgi:thioredoxin reductase (NADPH)
VVAHALGEILNQTPALGDVILQAFIARRQLLRESGSFTGLRVIGTRYLRDTFRIRDFLATNRVPFTWLDLEADPEVDSLMKRFGVAETDTPVVAFGRQLLLRNPSNRALAEAIGLRQPLEQMVYDLMVVGAGPAGLAAAVYAASEGLSTAVLERTAPGGQAGRSMRIENYLGFPTGVTGSDLAERAVIQAHKFGVRLPVPTPVNALTFKNAYPVLCLETGEPLIGKCLLIATGADYRRLDVEGCEQFEGCGVHYAATANEVPLCRGRTWPSSGAAIPRDRPSCSSPRTRATPTCSSVATTSTRACPATSSAASSKPLTSRSSSIRRSAGCSATARSARSSPRTTRRGRRGRW